MMKMSLLCLSLLIPNFLWAAGFDGSWAQDCQVVDGDVLQIKINVSGSEWIWQGVGFEEANCQKPYLQYEEAYSAKQTKAVNESDFEIDLMTKEISYTPLSAEVADALNQATLCGLHAWKLNQKTIVTGLNCDDRQIRKVGDMYFQKAKLQSDVLSWGLVSDANDGSSAAKRPQIFEPLNFKK